jgi:spore germination cell wall hydrolase CwlJ-like protein
MLTLQTIYAGEFIIIDDLAYRIGKSYPEVIEETNEYKDLVKEYSNKIENSKKKKKVSSSVETSNNTSTSDATDKSDDLIWIARTLYAECRGESDEGQLAVAEVILNRVAAGYGSNVYEVVTAKNQFAVSSKYNETGLRIAQRALDGERVFYNSNIFYFRMSENKVWRDFIYVGRIGCHSFYSR